jgi:hypothetical protein
VTPSLAINTATVSATEPDPDSSNNTATQTEIITFPTRVKLETFTAASSGSQVTLTWKTGGELHNLGFNVYREENGDRIRLNPSLIAGSALILRGGLPQHAAKTYMWIDRLPGPGSGSYWLEDIDLDGTRTLHGPVSPQIAPAAAGALNAKLISELNGSWGDDADTSASHLVEEPAVPNTSPAQQEAQFYLAAQPSVKILVHHEGWYRVTQPQLVAAGLDGSADPRFLRPFVEGAEQPIRVTRKRPLNSTAGASILPSQISGCTGWWQDSSRVCEFANLRPQARALNRRVFRRPWN